MHSQHCSIWAETLMTVNILGPLSCSPWFVPGAATTAATVHPSKCQHNVVHNTT